MFGHGHRPHPSWRPTILEQSVPHATPHRTTCESTGEGELLYGEREGPGSPPASFRLDTPLRGIVISVFQNRGQKQWGGSSRKTWTFPRLLYPIVRTPHSPYPRKWEAVHSRSRVDFSYWRQDASRDPRDDLVGDLHQDLAGSGL